MKPLRTNAFLCLLVVSSALAQQTEERFTAMNPEQRRAFEIEVMEKVADLALIPPKLNTSPLPKYDYDQLAYGMTIGIARTPGGRLWACWVAGEDGAKAFFVCAVSDDDGETWSKPVLAIDGQSDKLPMPRSVLVGNLWTDPLGRLWIFFNQSMAQFDGRSGVWAAICENPDSAKPVWSAPKRLWHGFTLNKPTVLSNGDWLLPISLNRAGFGPFNGAFKELDPFRGANAFLSKDQGATWQRQGHLQFPNPDWDEHSFIERQDGSLWMVARTGKGPMQSFSTDLGKTWSTPTAVESFSHPVSRLHLRRLVSGRLLLMKHGEAIDTNRGRKQLSAWLSDDEGLTWQGGLMLDERDGVSYPDGFQSPDGTIYVSYDHNRSTDGEILLSRFIEEDILAKKLIGPKSKHQDAHQSALEAEGEFGSSREICRRCDPYEIQIAPASFYEVDMRAGKIASPDSPLRHVVNRFAECGNASELKKQEDVKETRTDSEDYRPQ
jgi:hypothetical protein